jgi:hypothetical protein
MTGTITFAEGQTFPGAGGGGGFEQTFLLMGA